MKFLDSSVWIFTIIVWKIVSCWAVESESGRTLIVVKSKFKCPKNNFFNLTRLGQEVTVFSPSYPFSYPNNINCRYYFNSPVNTRMKLKCHISLPHQLFKCEKHTGDAFVYSLIGDDALQDRRFKLCGRYLLKSYSVAHKLLVGIRSGPFNFFSLLYPTKKFKCSVKVIRGATVLANGTTTPTMTGGGEMVPMPSSPSCGIAKVPVITPPKIIGGDMAAIVEFPWRCLIQVRMGSTVKRSCTCSIISNQWILSSVHCTLMEEVGNVFVYVGSNSYAAADTGLPVTEILQNEKYSDFSKNDDTSLLHLSKPLEFTDSVGPICLPCKFKGQQFLDSTLSVSGFVEMGGSFTLLHKDLMTLDRLVCMLLLPINGDEICVYEKGKEECVETGETGSYADYLDPETGLYYAAGIYSWSSLCTTEKKPSVYQNVARYLDWIESTTGQKFC